MIELALKAQLPLVKVTTTDTLNAQEVIQFLVDDSVTVLNSESGIDIANTEDTYFITWGFEGELEALYTLCVEHDKTVVFINLEDVESELVFDAGGLPVPPDLIWKHLKSTGLDDPDLRSLIHALGGLTLKEIAEVARLAMASSGELTASSIMMVRRLSISRQKGLQQVDTNMAYYIPDGPLDEWLDLNSKFFLTDDYDERLVPRGLMFYGPPGTGKTMGAKRVANHFGVPLYMLDLGGMLGKYVGESEGNLQSILSQIDREEPCVLLLDEVEKLFKTSDDSGVTSRILSRLLWWLNEHRSRVITVMTTNDIDSLPSELYRPGRIDELIGFLGLDYEEALTFARGLLNSFGVDDDDDVDEYMDQLGPIIQAVTTDREDGGSVPISQSEITGLTINLLKHFL